MSFENVKTTWLQEIDRYAVDNVVKILVGNKYDLAYLRQVEKEAAQVKNLLSYSSTSKHLVVKLHPISFAGIC